jgi:hypothetical protein
MLGQELAALHQRHGMGVHLGDGVPVVLWQTADAMGDMQFVLAYNGRPRVAQQLIVVQQTSGNGILYGQHTDGGRVLLDALKDLFEGGAADELHLLALEIEVRRNVVKRPRLSLNGYSLHLFILTKKLRFHLVCEAEPYFISSIVQFFNLTYGQPLHNSLQSKSKSRKSKHCDSTFFFSFLFIGCKSNAFSSFLQIFCKKFSVFSYNPSGLTAE